jgi:hypothetical protein
MIIKKKDEFGYSTESLFNDTKWLASALADSTDGRFHVSTIWVKEDGSALATDGMRMHVVSISSLEAGYYRVAKQTRWSITLEKVAVADICDFPDTDDVIAGMFQSGGTVEIVGACEDKPHEEFANLIRHMKTNTISFDYFVAAVKGMEYYDIKFDDSCEKAFYFTNNNRTAIVMPYRTES